MHASADVEMLMFLMVITGVKGDPPPGRLTQPEMGAKGFAGAKGEQGDHGEPGVRGQPGT